MIDAYLKIEGVPGESNAKGYEKQIEIQSYSHNVHQSTDISASSTGGATTGPGGKSRLSRRLPVDFRRATRYL